MLCVTSAPMLLAQQRVLHILAMLLGNGFVKRHHLTLVGVARVCLPLLTRLFLLHQESLLNFLEAIE